MNRLDRRDFRRADALLREASRATNSPLIHPERLRDHIAAALKREREEAVKEMRFLKGPEARLKAKRSAKVLK